MLWLIIVMPLTLWLLWLYGEGPADAYRRWATEEEMERHKRTLEQLNGDG